VNDRIVIAPDKFKGSLTALQAAEAIRRGVLAAEPDATCKLCPMADGGEGTVEVFLERGAQRAVARVQGPRGKPVDAVYARHGETAILEMASASGLELLEPSQRDPTLTSTFGTGELLRNALDAGARRFVIGIGGSATNDAGIGMLRALGAYFLDGNGAPIEGDVLEYERTQRIDLSGLDARIGDANVEVAVDVDNPLCGPDGASRTFAPQKGATPEQVDQLERVLAHLATVAAQTLRHDYSQMPGAGAAGGLGFAFAAFLHAKLEPGVRLIARECGLDELLADATLCLTGEGKIDLQTLHGKTVAGVAEIACKHGVPVTAFGGVVEMDAVAKLAERGVRAVPIAPPGTPVEESIRDAAAVLESAAMWSVQEPDGVRAVWG
jgi:glycerate kinase